MRGGDGENSHSLWSFGPINAQHIWLAPQLQHPTQFYLELGAGALLTETRDTVKVVGGDGLVLLLNETEGREVESSMLAFSIFNHWGHRVFGATLESNTMNQWRFYFILVVSPFHTIIDIFILYYEVIWWYLHWHKEVKKCGVCWMGRNWSIASIKEHIVPIEKGALLILQLTPTSYRNEFRGRESYWEVKLVASTWT